jgi:hypothetical protein
MSVFVKGAAFRTWVTEGLITVTSLDMLLAMSIGLSILSIILILMPAQAFAAPGMEVKTTYDDERDRFITKGEIHLATPVTAVQTVAARFEEYGRWALRGINLKASGKPFIIQLRTVEFFPGPPYGKGYFQVGFDVDLIWPFGRKNQTIMFGIVDARPATNGGIHRLEVDLYGPSRFIKGFKIVLVALAKADRSAVLFEAEVKLTGFVDTFFPLSVYRRNIEYRVVKVIENLRYFLTTGRPD